MSLDHQTPPIIHLVKSATADRTACGLLIMGTMRVTLIAGRVTCLLCQVQMESDHDPGRGVHTLG